MFHGAEANGFDDILTQLRIDFPAQISDRLNFLSVNASESQDLARAYGVTRIPAIRLLRYVIGSSYIRSVSRRDYPAKVYRGTFDKKSLLSWLHKGLYGSLRYLSHESELVNFITTNHKSIIGYFPSALPEDLETFRSLAASMDDVSFAYSSDESVGSELELETDSILMLTPEGRRVFTTHLDDPNEMFRSLAIRSLPLVTPLSNATIQNAFALNLPILIAFVESKEVDINSSVSTAVRDSGLVFGIAQCNSFDKAIVKLREFLGSSDCPALWIIDEPSNPDSPKYVKPVINVSSSEILDFVSHFSQKQLIRYVKSDLIEPLSIHEARVIVGANWDDFKSSRVDKLILFYAPWCSFCASSMDLIDEVAESLNTESIVVAKMDKSRNDSPGVRVEEYPTILFMSYTGSINRYTGSMTVDAVASWARSRAATRRYEL
jgi:thiol-disulfide isomerase/thioredoxin